MGYITSANTTTLTAKLTPIGRKKLISSNNELITSFSIGDSDANYRCPLLLTSGSVPATGGSIGPLNTITNSVGEKVGINSYLLVNGTGTTKKPVEPQSSQIIINNVPIGLTTVSGTYITQNVVSQSNNNTDPLVNLFNSLNLPINSTSKYKFTGLTSNQGGYSDTALSGLAQESIVVIAINNSRYGEVIDGKTIKLSIDTYISGYTIYSSFQNSGQPLEALDGYISDNASTTNLIGSNIALLFSDDIKKPNGDDNLSWSTGWNTIRPFSTNRKQPYNYRTNTTMNQYADEPVGIAYLDKGLLVLTHPTLVSWFNPASLTTSVTFDSVSVDVSQNITCLVNRGEFGKSTNTTFTSVNVPRMTEIGLYDADGDLIAIAKLDRQLELNVNEFLALGIKINL